MELPLGWWIWIIFPATASYSPYRLQPVPISTQKGVRIACNNNDPRLPPDTYDYMAIQIACNQLLRNKDLNYTDDTFKIYSSQRLYVSDISVFGSGDLLNAVGMRVIQRVALWCPNELLKTMAVYVNIRFKALAFMCDYCVNNPCGIFKANGHYMNAATLYEVKYPKEPDKTVFHVVEIAYPNDADAQVVYASRIISERKVLGTNVYFPFGPGDQHPEGHYVDENQLPGKRSPPFATASYVFFGAGVFLFAGAGVLCCLCLKKKSNRRRGAEISYVYDGISNAQREDSSAPPVPSMARHPSNRDPARRENVSYAAVQHPGLEKNEKIKESHYEPMKSAPLAEYVMMNPIDAYEPMNKLGKEVACEEGKQYMNVAKAPNSPPPKYRF